jgi:hypothetical protein
MNRFAKIMQVIGWVGVVLLTIVWGQGFMVHDNQPQLARHSTLALAAALLCVLPRFWTIAYLPLAARARRNERRRSAVESAGRETSAAHRRRALIAAAVAIVGLSGSFALAGAILLRRVPALAHGIAGVVAIALQLVALMLERRALRADAEEMKELAASAPKGVPAAS